MSLYGNMAAWTRRSIRRQLLVASLAMGLLFLSFTVALEILLEQIGESRLSLREEWRELDDALELSRLSENMHAVILNYAIQRDIPPAVELQETQDEFSSKIEELIEYQSLQKIHQESHQDLELEMLQSIKDQFANSIILLDQIRGENSEVISDEKLTAVAKGFASIEHEISRFGSLSEKTMEDAIEDIKAAQKRSKKAILFWMSSFILMTGVFFIIAGIKFVRPVERLNRAVSNLVRGRFKDRIPLDRRDELGELAIAFNNMAAELETYSSSIETELQRQHLLASVGRLAAGVAHEINNPLAAIGVIAEGMLRQVEKKPNETQILRSDEIESIRSIRDEVYRCKSMTDKLLDLSRKKQIQLAPLDLPALVSEVVQLMKPQAAKRSIEIDLELNRSIPMVVGDAHQIKQVLLNLLLNAMESHADSESEHPWIRIHIVQNGTQAGVTVSDNGEGIAQEDLQRLFEPFFTTKEDRSGSGLGLALSYAITTAHSGRLMAESDGRGQGATFTMTLPIAQKSALEFKPEEI